MSIGCGAKFEPSRILSRFLKISRLSNDWGVRLRLFRLVLSTVRLRLFRLVLSTVKLQMTECKRVSSAPNSGITIVLEDEVLEKRNITLVHGETQLRTASSYKVPTRRTSLYFCRPLFPDSRHI
jgi:hypothetical protein